MGNVKKSKTLSDLDPILREVFTQRLDEQLRFQAKVLGDFTTSKPRKVTFKDKWKKFWKHIPDFIDYVRSYEYENWRYWDRDGF